MPPDPSPVTDSVPIFVDSAKGLTPDSLVRCTYFSIECSTPAGGWSLQLQNDAIPFLMLGLSGIIQGPLGGGLFTDPAQIDALFERIERDDSDLCVDINELWLPVGLFAETPQRGSVFRIPVALFARAIAFTAGRETATAFLSLLPFAETQAEAPVRALPSPAENKAFRAWEDLVVARAKEQYPKNESMRLPYTDDNDGGPSPGTGAPLPPPAPRPGGIPIFPHPIQLRSTAVPEPLHTTSS